MAYIGNQPLATAVTNADISSSAAIDLSKLATSGNLTATNITASTGLTLGSTLISATGAELNVLDGIPSTLTATELGYLDGVTSAIQTQLNAKGTVSSLSDLSVTSTSAELNVLDGIPASLTATELGYVDGVTSAIQTQLNAKVGTTHTGDVALTGKLDLSKGVVDNTTTVSYASSIALTLDNGAIQTVTLTGNVTFTDSLNDGEAIVLMLNGGASHTVTWTAVTKWVTGSGNAAPTLTASDAIILWKIGSAVYAATAGSFA